MRNLTEILFYLNARGILRFIPDKMWLKYAYKKCINRNLHLDKPETFNEKLQWLKLYDRNPKYTNMVDKFEAKKIVSEIIGEEYIIKTLGVWDCFDDINLSDLPNKFVLKCTHDSGGVVICKDKEKFNIVKARNTLTKAMSRNYFYHGREWPYKNIKPRIIAEELLECPGYEDVPDYKIMCFNGIAKCLFVCTERNSVEGLKVTFFDKEWNVLPFERHYHKSQSIINPPSKLNEMIQLAEKCAKDIPFVRVDFYEIDGKLYFGELTFFPGSGFEEFYPEQWDLKLGEMIKLPC